MNLFGDRPSTKLIGFFFVKFGEALDENEEGSGSIVNSKEIKMNACIGGSHAPRQTHR